MSVTTSFKLSGKEGGIKLNPSATPALNQRSISSTISFGVPMSVRCPPPALR